MTKEVVVVTGCSKGSIGYSLATKFAQEGNKVYATARKLESLEGLEELGCEKAILDVLDQQSIDETIQRIIDEVGHIDILVNNAGAPAVGALLDIDFATAHQCVNTNVFGVLAVTRTVAKHMTKRRRGKIINIGSVVGYASTPWAGIYCLSKAALHSMTDTLRMELKPFNIQVAVVAPGTIKSKFGDASSKTVSVPEDSLYTSVASFIMARASFSQGSHSTPTDVFASNVVSEILRPVVPSYITSGALSWRFIIFYYLPVFFKEWFFNKRFGINEVVVKE